ncbi:MAG TPA: cyclic nucleotide-binding domain-containing protein [Candidatus Limnocylindrales bacterium]|nr:cyclic nucleotide-binding domain-containing protein [Candidatus Limnocylindrales bacterium]
MADVWAVLRSRLDYATFVPRPRSGIERSDLRKRDGSAYTILKNPAGDRGAGTYVRLEPEDLELFELMDGRRDVQAILIEQLERRGHFAVERLARLTATLAANGFFGAERADAYARLRLRRAQRDPLSRAASWLRRLIMWNIATWPNLERPVDVVYRAVGWLAFTRVGALALVAFAIAGLVVWTREFAAPGRSLFALGGSQALAIGALVALQVLSISIHEAGHALAIRHYGRRVRQLGLAIYYLFPCLYVDSTDMVLASRRQRIVVALAGPLGGLVVGAACAFVAAAAPGTLHGHVAFLAATLFVFQFVLNLLPILELDGYHVLVDALDAPLLRQRALAFVRGAAFAKLHRRERWSAREVGLALYGASAVLTTLAVIIFSLWLWETRIASASRELLRAGPVGAAVLALITTVFIGPLLIALLMRIAGGARSVRRRALGLRGRSRQALLAERVAVLARVPFLAGLPGVALSAIGSHLDERPAAPGEVIVTAGETGDRFYLVRSGRLEVLDADSQPRGTIGAGEGFGELALLDRTPRTATVRATEPSVLWSLDRGHFHRWVRDRYEIAARIRSDAEERTRLKALPFFARLSEGELDRVARRMTLRRVPAGETVVRAGEPPDRYYVIREGTAEVSLPDGSVVRRLGPGEGFGELALLFGGPRTATVTAVTDLVLSALDRTAFAGLVRASEETVGDFRQRTAHYVGAGLGGAVRGGS